MMRHVTKICLSFLVAVAMTAVISAQSPRSAMLVSTEWLAVHLNDPDLVLLHIGDKAEYDAKHIAGARFVTGADVAISDPAGLTLQLPGADDLRRKLQVLGISDSSRVIVYYGKDRVAMTTRVVFTLDAAGLGDRVSLLDGGMGAWERDGRATTSAVPAATTASLSPLTLKPVVVDAAFVEAHLNAPHFRIVDARLPGFYDGTQTGGSAATPHKTGHIVGARSIPFDSLTDATYTWKSTADLAAAFDKAGVSSGDTVIAYCHIGQQATAVVFAARTLGIDVKLYDGSFEDWSKRGLPVEKSIK
jgi:thiosulfate/3-mercaptopyruvate sulfurtransferase